ncbi:MAG: hypothetical protein ACE5KH_01530 [Candidatus Geothermarchaeales archaeon]
MENNEWSKGKKELDLPSPRGRLGVLKSLLGSLLPQRRHTFITSPGIGLASEASRRAITTAKTGLETQKAQASEIHRMTLIR